MIAGCSIRPFLDVLVASLGVKLKGMMCLLRMSGGLE
jgi:hypothetical protein